MAKLTNEQSKQIRIGFIRILIPTPEQRDPRSWPMAAARRTIDELVKIVETVIEEK